MGTARRGRPPKPKAAHQLAGTFREDRHGPAAEVVRFEGGLPDEPTDLPPAGLEHWRAVVPLIASVVERPDAAALWQLCFWWAQARRCQDALAKLKPSDKRAFRTQVLAAQAFKAWDSLASRFGLTPVDRAKLRKPADEGKPKGLAAFAQKRGAG